MPRPVYTRAHASVRFFSATLDPLAVTVALRLPPDHTHRVGEPRLERTGKGAVIEYAPYREGMWSMSSAMWVQSGALRSHLEWLLGQLESRREAIEALLHDGHAADLYCFSAGSSPLPPSLPRALRARTGGLGMEILIDHYNMTPRSAARPDSPY